MEFRLAEMKDLEQMCEITEAAKAQLKNLGLDQWQKGYPNREIWTEDIKNGDTWVAVEGDVVLGAFAYFQTPDPSYGVIDGAWKTGDDSPYASVHRVCVSDKCKGKGVAGQMFAHAFSMAKKAGMPSVRIDTHPGNMPMRRALQKAGFELCGEITLAEGSEAGDIRVAFEYLL